MKVVTPKQMSEIESEAYKGGSLEKDFMEEAGSGVALVVHDYVEKNSLEKQVILLCGKGNNAGDAYVAGYHLIFFDYDVIALQTFPLEECTPLCKENQKRFVDAGGTFREIHHADEMDLPEGGVIVDGLFGTGFRGKIESPIDEIIEAANQSRLPIIAIDIPSGLNGETGRAENVVITANETAFLGLPKTGFFLNEGWNLVGKLNYVDFGLPDQYVEKIKTPLDMLETENMRKLLPPITRNRHKYQAGYVVGWAGSPGMPGAALLSCYAALGAGAGIVRLLHLEGMQTEIGAAPYELLRMSYNEHDTDKIIDEINHSSACFLGPGLGSSPSIRHLLEEVIPHIEKPCVLDADALNFMAENTIPFPKDCILTPHLGEMRRLLNSDRLDPVGNDTLDLCQDFADHNKVTLVLKGAPTFIFHEGEPIVVNPNGDPGMATAGCGDVLTGIITSLLAQGLAPYDAAVLGVYLHSMAGEFAAREMTSYCMIASDIIDHLSDAFKFKSLR